MSDDLESRVRRQSIRGYGLIRLWPLMKMCKHACLRYMSMSPMGGFNVVSMKHGKEEKRHGRRS
jgi:hypothetical protein